MPQTVLITGASRGFGAFCSQMMLARGWRVFATARQSADLEALITHGIEAVPLELTDSKSVAACLNQVMQATGGRLDVLVNNAATGVLGSLVGDTPPDRTDMVRDFQANVFGTVELSLQAARAMQDGPGRTGRIIFVSSVLGLHPAPEKAVYAASKAALNSFADSFAMEFDAPAIRVSNLILGPLAGEGGGLLACSHATAGRKLLHACTARRPKTVYHAGLPTHLLGWLQRLAPRSWVRRMMGRSR